MFDFLKKKKEDENIVVLKKTEPGMCGGTDATQDKSAPTEIKSDEMILFDVKCALGDRVELVDEAQREVEEIGYISAFAAPAKEGTFLFFGKGGGFRRNDKKDSSWAYVKENVFPRLAVLVKEENLAKKNGFHSVTHGLPENFGGSVSVLYASGEKISFSNNQSPVISGETGKKIARFFDEATKGERVALPGVSELKEIRFAEERGNGGYTKATLTLLADGTGMNKKASRYDDPTVYESEKPVDSDAIAAIKKDIEKNGILAWESLPQRAYIPTRKKTLTFVFGDGREITVTDDKTLPDEISRGFFDIELEMTTRH